MSNLTPPTFDRFIGNERNLPQHDESLPSPEGKNGRYLWVSNQHWNLGWGNIFGPLYAMSLVAYRTNRAFVFEPYTWHRGPEPHVWHEWEKRLVPSRVPLTALISGPLAGGPFPDGDGHPRSVSEEFFKRVSEGKEIARLSIKEINEGLEGKTGKEILDKYVQVIEGTQEDCVELYGDLEHPFDFWQFGDASINTIYEDLAQSPFIKNFNWSSLVLSALRSNANVISPLIPAATEDLRVASPTEIEATLPKYIPELLVLHVRRGDYVHHWEHLCKYDSLFYGWNQVPGMGDKFNPEEEEGTKEDIYRKHAFPSDEQIVKKVNEVRKEWEAGQPGGRKLRHLYIATNGTREETVKLMQALREDSLKESNEWLHISSTYLLTLDDEQSHITYAIDSAIAERAGVFIGTGFTSMTANINFMRRVHGLPLETSRFW